MIQNSSLSAICQSNLTAVKRSIFFSFLNPPVCLPLHLFPTTGNFYLCGVKLCVCPRCLLHVCLLAFRCCPQKCTLFYSQHRHVYSLFQSDYIICILLPDKLNGKTSQTNWIYLISRNRTCQRFHDLLNTLACCP